MQYKSFSRFLTDSINANWEYNALSDYQGDSFHYRDVAGYIHGLHHFFRDTGVAPGDKIALIGKNSARWGILYIATVTYGAAIVPILPDFKPADLHQITDHSDAVLLFAEVSIYENMDFNSMPQLKGVLSIGGMKVLDSRSDSFTKAHQKNGMESLSQTAREHRDKLNLPEIPGEHLAVISYTSGTTGFTKGVMLPHRSLAANMQFAHDHMPLNPGDRIVSFLPLAHTFGAAFEFLFPFTLGCEITILTKTPSPQVIMKAFQEIRPSLILSVPLVIEKIYKKQVLPAIRKPHMKALLAIPGIRNLILKKIRDKLTAVFGGGFRELVIGGAAFNSEAEAFFASMKFPFTVGYGMTECGPLISYTDWRSFKKGSAGKPVDSLELKIDSPDPEKVSGEIMVRGENVMLGYYKNDKATQEVLQEDGWLHTGDLGRVDGEGNVYLRGRIKSLILGASGKNIYPEEIESHFNNRPLVAETLVVQQDEKLTALIFPDLEEMAKTGMKEEELKELFEHHRKAVNHILPGYMNISRVEIVKKEFIKTPKRSIQRFLYS